MVERLKTAAVFLLTITMAALLMISLTLGVHTDSGILSWLSAIYLQYSSEQESHEDNLKLEIAAFPSRIAVTNRSGVYSAWNEEDYARLYGAISGIYSEALGSIGQPQQISEAEFTALLGYPSIYLGFSAGLPLDLHYAWTGSGVLGWDESSKPMKTAIIGKYEDGVAFAFYCGNGEYYIAQTGTSLSRLESLCGSIADVPNSMFACQSAEFTNLAGDELIYDGKLDLPVYEISQPDYISAGELPRQLLEAFSIRHYLASFFVSGTGAIQYSEGAYELTAGLNGELIFASASLENPIGVGLTPGSPEHSARAVESAREIVTDIWSKTSSPGRLSLDLLEYENDTYYLGFSMHLGGFYVDLSPRPVYVIIKNGYITAIGVHPQTIVQTGSVALHYKQLASAAIRREHGQVGVLYTKQNSELHPVFAIVEDGG